jgi:alkylhydroperoxidase family enzyme
MLKWLFRRRLSAFERALDCDMGYAHDILDAGVAPYRRLMAASNLVEHADGVPIAAFSAAKIVATIAEDCGPCVQLVVALALRDGAQPAQLRAILTGDEQGMNEDVRLAYGFAKAVLARESKADALRQEIIGRWGQQGLAALALGIAGSRVFPCLKYALGHGKACTIVRIGEDAVAVAKAR